MRNSHTEKCGREAPKRMMFSPMMSQTAPEREIAAAMKRFLIVLDSVAYAARSWGTANPAHMMAASDPICATLAPSQAR